jgi:hypothetical protein
MAREDWVAMMRIRNEERWIARNLERTWQVAKTVVIWDDGSDDHTEREVEQAFPPSWDGDGVEEVSPIIQESGLAIVMSTPDATLHYLRSPFRPAVNDMEAVSEIRDKNILWWYTKAQTTAKKVLCLDGDETLSLDALRNFTLAEKLLDEGVDMLEVPFIYLWNDEQTRRCDAIYGDRDGSRGGEVADGLPRLRFPRMFTTQRCDPYDVFEQRFAWYGHRQGRRVLGGFHCGSVPQENFHPNGGQPKRGVFPHPVVHFGYLDYTDRVAKHAWYNKIDPKNVYEGEYSHIIEVENLHTPGPSEFRRWEDK